MCCARQGFVSHNDKNSCALRALTEGVDPNCKGADAFPAYWCSRQRTAALSGRFHVCANHMQSDDMYPRGQQEWIFVSWPAGWPYACSICMQPAIFFVLMNISTGIFTRPEIMGAHIQPHSCQGKLMCPHLSADTK